MTVALIIAGLSAYIAVAVSIYVPDARRPDWQRNQDKFAVTRRKLAVRAVIWPFWLLAASFFVLGVLIHGSMLLLIWVLKKHRSTNEDDHEAPLAR
jgi:hypothetical protein